MLNCVIYKNAFCLEEESYLLPKDGLQIKKVEWKILCTMLAYSVTFTTGFHHRLFSFKTLKGQYVRFSNCEPLFSYWKIKTSKPHFQKLVLHNKQKR